MAKDTFSKLFMDAKPATYKYFDGEKWTTSTTGKTIKVISPVDGKVFGSVQAVSKAEADQAIKNAKQAQKEWARVPLHERAKIIHAAAQLLRAEVDFLSDELVMEIGKPRAEAKDEVVRSADMVEAFAREAEHIRGEEIRGGAFPGYDDSKICMTEHVPHGTVLAIGPFNYPINLSVSKIAPALMMGNSVIFKPPTQGSIAGLYLTELFRKVGLPKGLLVTLTGSGSELGDYLTTHPGINMVTFTGSSDVGKQIATHVGMVPMLFECGGNNPALVLPDADLKLAAGEIVKGAFSYAGQRCTGINYVLGLKATLDKLLPLVVEKAKSIKMGDPRESGVTMGPVISEKAAVDIEKQIQRAKTEGAKIVLGGKRKENFIEPTILESVTMKMEVVATETFGPVVSFVQVKSIDEALEIIHQSPYGLQVSLFTSDEGGGLRLGTQIDTGTVQLNNRPQRGPDHFPFMGVKDSGIGVQGIRYALQGSTRLKSIVLNKPQ